LKQNETFDLQKAGFTENFIPHIGSIHPTEGLSWWSVLPFLDPPVVFFPTAGHTIFSIPSQPETNMPEAEKTSLSVQEYLDREASAELKSEYVQGELFAMTGGPSRTIW
jgi:hypothetical protein